VQVDFFQVPVKLKDQAKTAFSTREGHFQYKRMPFGLKGVPATFQRLMTTVLSGVLGIKCIVYHDDVVVFGENLKVEPCSLAARSKVVATRKLRVLKTLHNEVSPFGLSFGLAPRRGKGERAMT